MVLWRISNHADLAGLGGLIASSRWHNQGHRIIYLAATPSAAMIESIVHLELPEELLPDTYQLLKLEIPDSASRERIDPASLPEGWTEDAVITRKAGDAWLRADRSALLEVPSAIVPETSNWVLNPDHADAKQIRIEWSRRFPYDSRLFRKRIR